jgi:tRNA 2-thiocytidine biosynthesis protein TtcA
MFRALMNVRPSHLADPAVFDFAGLLLGQSGGIDEKSKHLHLPD